MCMDSWDSCFGKDPDDVFSYPTLKLVRIRDRRLGILHLSLTCIIFVYIVVFKLVFQHSYCVSIPPDGAFRMQTWPPMKGGCNPSDSPNCQLDFTPMKKLDYCTAETPCVDWDETNVAVISPSKGMLMTTSFQKLKEELVCDDVSSTNEYCAQTYKLLSNSTYNTADIERFTIAISHSVSAAQTLQRPGKFLIGDDSHDVNTTKAGGVDYFTLGFLLKAARVSLDKDNRAKGMVLYVAIDYNNLLPWVGAVSDVRYTYTVEALSTKTMRYGLSTTYYDPFPEKRTILKRAGIFVVVDQRGTLGQFDFSTLLIQCTTSLALLAVATKLVDQLALRVMKNRIHCKRAKYELTEDFSDMEDQKKARESAAAEQEMKAIKNPIHHRSEFV